ncbi:nucleotidyltransferase family protein [Occallatibacter riparius]|uniref:Nucleotidyltransferase family protein n=1 Tax=Occallatibacter riparius TaxID=1002689 RepID=A0A9J7BMR9_9BACT|nr:nucleotidyltransferase family protein [Occallatibacter riparius]UWZ83935.1 nucleotidyltransferase family protein [Occallatibacter riparius]
MKAMVLAAGLGTRLRPLTNDRPKALVEVGGRTMLEITLERLRAFGVREVIVNVHHYADMMIEYLRAHQNFGMRIEVSREEELLDTGGGIKKAAWFFLEDGRDEPFLVHNVDVMSTIDLTALTRAHSDRDALATLAVQDRTTSRYLLFDEEGQLCGRRAARDGVPEMVRTCAEAKALAFSGIHVMSPRLLKRMSEDGAFSIIATYLRLAGEGERILVFRADAYQWRDLGKPENVAEAARELKS